MLFAAVAVVGVLGAATVKMMRGPLNTMVEVNRRTAAESQIAITSKLGMMTSALQANSGDCEASPNEDGYVEPMEWVDASGAGPDGVAGSEGGGWLPDEYGVTKKDPWGSNYGYCVWDAGPVVNDPGCGGATQKRLQGSGTDYRGYPVIAIISAGPDRTFQTGCEDFATADTNSNGTLDSTEKMVVKASGSDDVVMQYTYAEASVTAGGLWELKSGSPDTAVTAKNVEIGGTATFTGGVAVGPTGSGDFPTVKTDIIQPLSPTQPAPEFTAGLMLSNTATAGNACLNTELGSLSMDAATPTQLLACLDNSGTSEWITIGGANFLWQEGATAGEIYYNGGNVGIGTNDPNLPLDIVGDAGLTGDLRLTDTHSVLWGDGTTSVRGSGPGSVEFLTGGATRVTVDSSGLVGIGVAPAASTRLIVQGTGTTNATTALNITDSAGAPVLTARDNAQVGIGNAAPNDALDVTGSVDTTDSFKIDGNVVLYVPNGVDENILVGKAAGAAVTGDNNAVLGASAAVSLGAGTDNLIAGQASAIALDGGSFNTILGQGAGPTLVGGDRNILIGASDTTPIDVPAAGTNDYLNIGNTIFGDLANDYVGIGVASPNDALDVAGNIDATGNVNTGGNFTINSVVFGPASQCTAAQKLQWSNASGWSCVTDLNDGSAGTPQDLESVLTAGNDANTLTAVNLGGVAIGSTTLSTGGTQDLVLDVTGAAGADYYCDADGNNCFSAASVGSIDTFLELTDTPVNYTGAGTWLVRVNAGGTGLEFINPASLSTAAAGNTGEIQFNNAGAFAASSNFFWDNAAVELGIGTNTPGASLDVATTDSVILPRGTTGERSGTPVNGMIRYNSTANKFEVYENGAWKYIQTGASTGLAYIELSDTPAVYTGAAYKLAMVNPTETGMIFSYNDAVLLPSGTTAERPGTATNGMIRYNGTNNKFEVYQNGAWVNLITSGAGSALAIDDLTDAQTDYTTDHNLIMGRAGATALTAGAQYNLFIGEDAGATTANSTATTDQNTAVGYQALTSLTTGGNNTASGYHALGSSTTGSDNTASGARALGSSTTGYNNTASGARALGSSTTGSDNTASGVSALRYNTTGNNNAVLGGNAGLGVSGTTATSNNVFVGARSGYGITTGGNHTFLGYQSGDSVTTGTNDILIGYNVDTPTATTSNFLNIGDTIYGDLSTDQIRIGGTGALSGFSDLDVAGTLAVKLSAGTTAERPGTGTNGMIRYNSDNNKFEGYQNGSWQDILTSGGGAGSLDSLSDAKTDYTTDHNLLIGTPADAWSIAAGGQYNLTLGETAGDSITTGSRNIAMGYGALTTGATMTDNVAIGYNALTLNQSGGVNNIAIGTDSSMSNTIGDDNVAIGHSALAGNIGYNSNIAIGSNAIGGDTDPGNYNIALGEWALFSGGPGANIAIGTASLYHADSGGFNLAFGYYTGFNVTDGQKNLLLGYQAGDSITTGSDNIILGYDVDTPTATTSDYLSIGDTIFGDLSTDQIRIGGTGALSGFSDLDITGTLAVKLSAGTTAQRPGTGTNGMIRYNSDNNKFEGYQNGSWQDILTSGGGAIAIDDLTDAQTDYATDHNLLIGTPADAWAIAAGGQYNLTLGETAGDSITTGDRNIAMGYGALTTGATMTDNIAIGYNALTLNQSGGTDNIAIGSRALDANTTGVMNIAIGTDALGSHSLFGQNIAIGHQAMASDASGINNVALGYQALTNLNGDDSTAVGSMALSLATNGKNTALGYQAGNSITTGQYNLLLGYDVDTPTATTSNFLNIGDTIFGDLSTDHIRIGGSGAVSAFSDLEIAGTLALKIPSGTDAQRPGTPAGGMIRYNTTATPKDVLEYYDAESAAWLQIPTSASGGAPLSGISAALADNTIANGGWNQVWNWALTGATEDAFTFGETTAATGGSGDQSVLKATTLASSTAVPLMVTNLGNGASFRVNDETGDNDATPFMIDADGNVGINYDLSGYFDATLNIARPAGSGGAVRWGPSPVDSSTLRGYLGYDGGSSTIYAHAINGDFLIGVEDTVSAKDVFRADDATGYALIGQGASSVPGAQLHVNTTDTTGNTIIEALRLSHEDSDSAAATGNGAAMTFNLETATDGTFAEAARIAGVWDDATDNSKDGSLRFYTMGPDATSGTTTTTETMRIVSGGISGAGATPITGVIVGAIAFGDTAVADSNWSAAIGWEASALNQHAYAIGSGAYVTGGHSMALNNNVAVSGSSSVGIGVGIASGVLPDVSNDNSLGIFMGDQSGVNFAAANTMGVFGGKMVIDPAVPATQLTARGVIDAGAATDAIVLPRGTDAQRPGTPAGGMIRYNTTATPKDVLEYYDAESAAWLQIPTSASGGAPLSGISAATTTNTIASGDNAQVWNWALTTAGKAAFTFGETTAATGGSGAQSILKATTLATSTAVPLMVTNLGNGLSLRINDETGDADTTPFVVDASGNVGVGLTNPSYSIDTAGDLRVAGNNIYGGAGSADTLEVHSNQHILMQVNADGGGSGSIYIANNATDVVQLAGGDPGGMVNLGGTIDGSDANAFAFGFNTNSWDAGGTGLYINASNSGDADAFIRFNLDNVTPNFSLGVDDSDSDKFKLSASGTLGTSDILSVTSTGDITMSGTGALQVHSGTTAQRPGTPANGMIRYNSTTNAFEVYENSAWVAMGAAASDRRLKKDIKPLDREEIVKKLMQVDTYSFRLKADATGRENMGVIAQQIETIFPDIVDGEGDEMKSVHYIELIAPLIETGKYLKAENDTLRADVTELKEQVALLNKSAVAGTGKASMDGWTMLLLGLALGGNLAFFLRGDILRRKRG